MVASKVKCGRGRGGLCSFRSKAASTCDTIHTTHGFQLLIQLFNANAIKKTEPTKLKKKHSRSSKQRTSFRFLFQNCISSQCPNKCLDQKTEHFTSQPFQVDIHANQKYASNKRKSCKINKTDVFPKLKIGKKTKKKYVTASADHPIRRWTHTHSGRARTRPGTQCTCGRCRFRGPRATEPTRPRPCGCRLATASDPTFPAPGTSSQDEPATAGLGDGFLGGSC